MEPTRLQGPGALIAALPPLLGFRPRESVVIVSLRRSGEVGIVLRVDRADCLNPDIARPLARSISGHLVRDEARSAFLVSFTGDEVRIACPAIDGLRPAISEVVEEVEAWAVVGKRYFSPGCARESCCPAKGRPIPTLVSGPAATVRVTAPAHRLAPAEPEARFEVDEAARRKAQRSGERWWDHRQEDVVAWRRRSFDLWRKALDGVSDDRYPTAPDAGKLIEALQDRRVRDALLVSLMPGSKGVALGVLDGSGDEEVSRALQALLSPVEGTPPLPDSVAPVSDLLGFLTAHARPRRRAPSLTLCAVLAWWGGDEQACQALLDRVHEAEPGYRLAGLLECTVLAGIDPGWKRAA